MDEAEAEETVRRLLLDALGSLESAATLLRGPLIRASADAMRLEIAVSRALDTLSLMRRR